MSHQAYIIHRWGETPQSDWYPWLQSQLQDQGWHVTVPTMPNTNAPNIDDWVSTLAHIIPNPDENTIFIGHSIGCQTILRYLETLPSNTYVGSVHLVAGWIALKNLDDDASRTIAKLWETKPIVWEQIRPKARHITAYFSTDDPWVTPANIDIFQINLNAEIVNLPNRGHFTDPTLPELLSKLI